jgi:putative endonuclease
MHSTIERGASAEARAVSVLEGEGYRIVERNFRCHSGELDIVAFHGEVLCFIEVRSRADDTHGSAAEMIDRRKQKQVARVALHFISLRDPMFVRSRFDVVAITGERVELIRDAWRM